jgi:transposase-like protein
MCVIFLGMMTLKQLMDRFPDEAACKQFLKERRWPDGVVKCPRCQNPKVGILNWKPFNWVCKNCGNTPYRFSVLVDTIFENTKYPLTVWFQVLWTMLNAKKGISALQIQRQIGCGAYKTAWYMCHRLRAALKDPDFQQLMGIVEVDEMYHGGKTQNMHRRKREELNLVGTKGKVPIIGAISRKGNIVCQMIENTDTATLDSFVRQTVNREKVELIATDEHSGYRLLGIGDLRLPHEFVRHSAGEYVHGVVHTNSIESFWSLFKRGVMGSYHKVSKKYLPLYLAEFQFRFNNRKNENIFELAIAGC